MEYENISLGEAIDILEEVMEFDDSIYAYNRKYRMALEFVIDCIKRDMAESKENADEFISRSVLEDIKAEIDDKSAQYAPGTDLSTIYNTTNLDLAWAWAFEGATGTEQNQTDDMDTKLGNLAVAEDLTIEIGVEITVTQID